MAKKTSSVSNFGKRVLAYLVLAVAIIIGLKLIWGTVIGFAHIVLTLALVAVVAIAVIWAFRHI